jgi:xanthine dehydrogenase accessory factor
LRFGVGSPLIDIRLPCGGGLDLLFLPRPSLVAIRAADDQLQRRLPTTLPMGLNGELNVVSDGCAASGWRSRIFHAVHRPDLRLFILGHGAEVGALTRLGLAHGVDVKVLTPERGIVDAMMALGVETHWLKFPAATPHLAAVRQSAIVMLFHDHDWEADLLIQAIEQAAFFIGAMGSRATHAARLNQLRAEGTTEAALRRIHGPIGLIPATRDPETLALSVLTEIVALYEYQGREVHGMSALPENVACSSLI